ncbi:MAG: phenylalanine--tRNA ligase subunit beta [Nanoarchaeota archaeon]
MPTITLDKTDLKRMVGDMADEELEEVLFLNKVEVEEIGLDEIKAEVTPDRPDMFSIEGIARQIKSWLLKTKGLPNYIVAKPKIELKSKSEVRPYIVCAVVKGLNFTDEFIKSFMQLEELVDKTIGRDREKSSIGVHDITDVKPNFTYKDVDPKTKFVPLGYSKEMTMEEILQNHPKGKEYGHIISGHEKYPLIVDKKGKAVSFPPITNAAITQVKEGTKDIFIDITGTDEKRVNDSLNILVTALADRGGTIEGVNVDKKTTPNLKPKIINFDLDYARSTLGLNEDNNKIKELLERMNYGFDIKNRKLSIPAYRSDILHPIDVVEDIAIAYGYNNFITEFPMLPFIGSQHPLEEFSDKVKLLMVGLGMQEVINFTLTSEERHFKKMNTPPKDFAEIKNPISSEYSICRTSLLSTLMENLALNKHRGYPQKIFEVGDAVVLDNSLETKTRNSRKLCAVISHANANLSEIISLVNSIALNLGIRITLNNQDSPFFIKGRSGTVSLGSKKIGYFGEINPSVLENFDLKTPITALELDLDIVFSSLKK